MSKRTNAARSIHILIGGSLEPVAQGLAGSPHG